MLTFFINQRKKYCRLKTLIQKYSLFIGFAFSVVTVQIITEK